jgi:hypothetical protein
MEWMIGGARTLNVEMLAKGRASQSPLAGFGGYGEHLCFLAALGLEPAPTMNRKLQPCFGKARDMARSRLGIFFRDADHLSVFGQRILIPVIERALRGDTQ